MSSSSGDLTQKAASGVAWSAGFQVGRQLLSFASVSVLAHRVPPSAYGLIGMAAIVTSFVDNLRDMGTTNALIRERTVSERLLSSVFWLNVGLGVVLTAGVAAAAVPAARFFHQPDLVPVMQALAAVFIVVSPGVVHYSLLMRNMRFRPLMLANFAGVLCGTTVAIVAALRGAGVWSLVLSNLVTNLVSTVAFWLACPWRPRWLIDWAEIRIIRSYSIHLSGFNFVNYFSRNADNLVVGRFLGESALGQYQMSYTLMSYPINNISSIVASALFPAFSTFQDDDERFRSAFSRACAMIAMVTFPAMLGLAVVTGPFVGVVLGPRWEPVGGLLLVFAPLGMFQSIFTMVGLIYNAKGRSDWLFRWGLFSGCVYVCSFLIGLRWGIEGVAVAYSIAWMLLMVPGFHIPFRLIGLSWREFLSPMWPVCSLALSMTAACALWRLLLAAMGVHNMAVHLFSTAAIGCAIYIGLLLAWRPVALYELAAILDARGYIFLTRLLNRGGSGRDNIQDRP